MKNTQKGFAPVAVIIIVAVLAAVAGYLVIVGPPEIFHSSTPIYTQNTGPSSTPSTTQVFTGTTTPSHTPPATNTLPILPHKNQTTTPHILNGILSVAELDAAKDAYAGKQIKVKGKIYINPLYGEGPCPAPVGATSALPCDTIMGINLFLSAESSITPWNVVPPVLIYQNGKPYPCTHSSDTDYACGGFSQGEIRTLEGVFVKTQVPFQSIGVSGGGPPTVIKWQDFYYLDIANNLNSAGSLPLCPAGETETPCRCSDGSTATQVGCSTNAGSNQVCVYTCAADKPAATSTSGLCPSGYSFAKRALGGWIAAEPGDPEGGCVSDYVRENTF